MATKKSGKAGSNGRDSQGQRLGVKLFDGQIITAGSIIVRQRGTRFTAGFNVKRARDDSLFALKTGAVKFEKNGKRVRIDEPAPAS